MTKTDNKASAYVAALTGALLTAGLLGALIAQHVLQIMPCPLCLHQRAPYYIGLPLAIGVAYLARRDFPRNVVKCVELTLLFLLAWSLFLGLQHSGVELKLWSAPASCASGDHPILDVKDLRATVKGYAFVPCDKPGWELFGILSFANLNAILSAFLLLLNGLAFAGYDPRKLYGSRTVSQ